MFKRSKPKPSIEMGIKKMTGNQGTYLERPFFNMKRVFLLALALLLSFIQGCNNLSGDTSIEFVEETPAGMGSEESLDSAKTPLVNPTPTVSPFPRILTLALPSRWVSTAGTALASLPAEHLPNAIQLLVSEPTLELVQTGHADLALIPDAEGILVAERTLALAVPWSSDWEGVTLDEAQRIVGEGSPFVAVFEWSDLPPTLRPLLIDGLHPSNPTYPLRLHWSLHHRPGLEQVALSIAPTLAEHMVDEVVKLTAVGDIMLARGLGEAIRSGEQAFPFAAVQHLLTDADLTLGNLESALGSGGQAEAKGYTFLAPVEAAGSLALAGFDVLSLANNHAMDYGPSTLMQAIDLLEVNGISSVGAGANDHQAYTPLLLAADDLQLAFLSFVDVPIEVHGFDTRTWSARVNHAGVAWADPTRMRSSIEVAKDTADLVIVLLHSGYEYIHTPSPPQQFAARLAIEAGADLVIGHHAHVLQGVEFYGDGVIVYGLGNFAFKDGGVGETGVMNIWLDAGGVRSLQFTPLVLGEDGRPMPADLDKAEQIRSHFYSLTSTTEP
jgi:poly-gamma-glutamate capsule biosynthesis protein CapA/YwtB (metallophosphatase superfamily)